MRYFKVVRVVDDKFMSAIVSGIAAIEYIIGYQSTAPVFMREIDCHPLVFTSCERAAQFLLAEVSTIGCRAAVLECECTREVIPKIISGTEKAKIEGACGENFSMQFPSGTVSFAYIRPTRVITPEEIIKSWTAIGWRPTHHTVVKLHSAYRWSNKLISEGV